jgi:hypothetical protein
MKRVLLTALLTLGVLAGGAVSAHADPGTSNTITTSADCGSGGTFDVVIKAQGNAASTFDLTAPNGRAYAVLDVTVDVVPGVPPSGPPVFTFTKNYGNRNGYANPLQCTGSFPNTDPKTGDTFTNFFTANIISK